MPEKAQAVQDAFDAWDSALPDNEWWGGPGNRKRNRPALSVAEFNARADKGHFYRKARKDGQPPKKSKIKKQKTSVKGVTLEEQLKKAKERQGDKFDAERTTRWFKLKDRNGDGGIDAKERQQKVPEGWNKKESKND